MKLKALAALSCAAMMMFSFAGCSTPANAGKVGETDIPSGLYLLMQLNAYEDAASKVEDASKPVLKQTIDETPAEEWINQKTVENVQRYAGILALSEEHNITLSEEDEEMIATALEHQWDLYEPHYTQNGIGKETLKKGLESEQKSALLLDAIYGKTGTEAVSESDLNAYIEKNFADISFFSLPAMTPDYKFADETQKEELKKEAENAKTRLERGEDMETVAQDSVKKAYEILGASMPALEGSLVENSTVSLINNTESELLKAVFDTEKDKFGTAMDSSGLGVIVFQRQELKNKDEVSEAALFSMKNDELNQRLVKKGEELGTNLDESARKALSVKNIKDVVA